MSSKVAVIGQGYVGLPLALAAAEAGYEVVGIDTDATRVAGLNSGKSPIGDIADAYLAAQSSYRASGDFADAAGADVVILCLPTPLDADRNPDNSLLLAGASAVASYVSGSVLLVSATVAR